MNKYLTIFYMILSFLVGCGPPNEQLSHEEKLAFQIRSKIAHKLVVKYDMKVIGFSAAMPAGVINNLGLLFQVSRILTREEARVILVDGVQEFLAEVNANEEIRPYLKAYPFTAKNITVDIYMRGSKGENVYDPNIEAASAYGGKIWYATKDKNKKYGYKSEYKESFEEAVKLVDEAHANQQRGELTLKNCCPGMVSLFK